MSDDEKVPTAKEIIKIQLNLHHKVVKYIHNAFGGGLSMLFIAFWV